MTNDFNVVRVKGLEPPRQRRQNLNLVRLPIPPHPHERPSSNRAGRREGGGAIWAFRRGAARRVW